MENNKHLVTPSKKSTVEVSSPHLSNFQILRNYIKKKALEGQEKDSQKIEKYENHIEISTIPFCQKISFKI